MSEGVDTENIVEALLRFFLLEFTFRKMVALCLIALIILTAIWGYDRITGNLSTGRITGAVQALDELSKIDLSKPENQDLIPARKKIITAIENEVSPELIESSNFSTAVTIFRQWLFSGSTWAQFFAGAFLWLLTAIIGLVMMFKDEPNGFEVFRTLSVVAFVAGLIDSILPPLFWLNYLVYPVGSFVIITLVALVSKKRQETKNAGSPARNQSGGDNEGSIPNA